MQEGENKADEYKEDEPKPAIKSSYPSSLPGQRPLPPRLPVSLLFRFPFHAEFSTFVLAMLNCAGRGCS